MRLQIIEPAARFSCGSCGTCCDQPWRTVIDEVRAQALQKHDFSKYTQLRGKQFFLPPADGLKGFFDLAKGLGTRCLFLDEDNLCIIHKELGPDAKPAMCRQFPLLSSRTWVDERVTLNFACPSVRAEHGRSLTEQADDIRAAVPLSGRAAEPEQLIPLDGRRTLTQAENDELLSRIMAAFDDARTATITDRFAEALDVLSKANGGGAFSSNPSGPLAGARGSLANVGALTRATPLAVRMLFAATLQPDTLPAALVGRMGVIGRLTMIPRLMSLASLSGAYPSRLLGRNISIQTVIGHEIDATLAPESEKLLARYFRSRIWARTLVGTRLSIIAGIHQHIHDLNAILFFARAQAQHAGQTSLTLDAIDKGLEAVELHLANQPRVYDQVLKGWLRAQLNNLALAQVSLHFMTPTDKQAQVH